MSLPCCKIEVYDTSDDLDQTITTDILECHVKDIITSGIGTFNFTVPAYNGFSYVYDDIGNNYKVKIYFGYGGSYTHVFSGKIKPFTSNIIDEGRRYFEGKALGEILERRFKYNKRWIAAEADDIVAELCDSDNLDLSSDIDTDTTAETITVRTSSYFDVLRQVSDYWYDAGTQVKKDFYVDKDNELVWKARPWRTVGVETPLYGSDFFSYNLYYDILPVKNYITVYGRASAPVPLNKDDWTDSLTDWTSPVGSLSLADAAATAPNTPKTGTYWIKSDVDGTSKASTYYRTIDQMNIRNVTSLKFWHWLSNANADAATVYIYAPNVANSFNSLDGTLTKTAGVHFNDLAIGDTAEYDVDENPTGIWETYAGTPNWWNIQGVGFNFHDAGGGAGDLDIYVDSLYFYPERWFAVAEDATSQTAYEINEAEFTDDNLVTTAECQSRAETLLYQLKDRVLRLDFAVSGNTNILVGDRVSLDLPPDNVSAVDFDYVSVEHHFQGNPVGYQTVVHAVDSANTRLLPSMSPLESIQKQLNRSREVQAALYTRIVR